MCLPSTRPTAGRGSRHVRRWPRAKRLVLKLGTGVLTQADGQLARSRLRRHLQAVAALVKQGRQVVLVSSGAVGLGRRLLGLECPAGRLWACVRHAPPLARVGSCRSTSRSCPVTVSSAGKCCSIKATSTIASAASAYASALDTMLTQGVVPVLNENDAVVSEPLKDGVAQHPGVQR